MSDFDGLSWVDTSSQLTLGPLCWCWPRYGGQTSDQPSATGKDVVDWMTAYVNVCVLAAAGYGSLASAQAVLRFLSAHLLPQPRDPFDIPELHLRPVATPRAPVSPDPAPAVTPPVNPPSPEPSLQSPVTPGSVSVAQVYTPVRLFPLVHFFSSCILQASLLCLRACKSRTCFPSCRASHNLISHLS